MVLSIKCNKCGCEVGSGWINHRCQNGTNGDTPRVDKILHTLRNPYGKTPEEIKTAQLNACDEIEKWRDAYQNLQAWCDKNGWDTTARNR